MVGSYLPTSVGRLTRADLDVTDLAAVRSAFERAAPEAVIHLGAATDVDRSQVDRDYAFATNTLGTLNVSVVCRDLGIRLLYVSTGGVFDGSKMTFDEDDRPAPVNFYAWTKYEGEGIVRDLVADALILRAGWVMGGGPKRDHKFIGGLMRAFAEQRPNVEVVDDRFGSPTYARHFVRRALDLLDRREVGVWHCANEGVASRFEVAQLVAHVAGYRGVLSPVSSERFPTSAPRGRSEGLTCRRLRESGLTLPHWHDAVVEYLAEFADG